MVTAPFNTGLSTFPNLVQVALDFFPLTHLPAAHRLHNSGLNGRYSAKLWDGNTPFAVDFVLGAAMMVRGTVISQIGGLDDRYFMYCEEMDWCLRMARGGLVRLRECRTPMSFITRHRAAGRCGGAPTSSYGEAASDSSAHTAIAILPTIERRCAQSCGWVLVRAAIPHCADSHAVRSRELSWQQELDAYAAIARM